MNKIISRTTFRDETKKLFKTHNKKNGNNIYLRKYLVCQ